MCDKRKRISLDLEMKMTTRQMKMDILHEITVLFDMTMNNIMTEGMI